MQHALLRERQACSRGRGRETVVRGRYNGDGTEQAENSCADDHYCHEFTGYDTEPVSGLQYAGARFYDPELGMFLTHDPVRSAASPYGYCGGDPVNNTDPNGECPWCIAIIVAVAVATAIDVGIQTGDVGSALKAGISSVPMTIAGGAVGGAFLGTVTSTAATAFGEATGQAVWYAMVGATGGFGVYQAAAHGYYASAGLGAVLTGFGLYQMATGKVTLGAQPVGPGGSHGAGQGGNAQVGTVPGSSLTEQVEPDETGVQVAELRMKLPPGVTPQEASDAMTGILPGGATIQEGRAVAEGFRLTGRLKDIWNEARLFKNWLKGSQSLTRIGNPLSHAEALQVIENAGRLGIPSDLNPAGLQGLEATGRWGDIPHFKVGNIHIPVEPGFIPPP
jgi:RHS repeat-associated protein